MKKAREIFKSFPIAFVAEFTGTSHCYIKHPVFGGHKITEHQLKHSSASYLNRLYKNICTQIDNEVDMVNFGIYKGAKDEPIVNSPLIKMIAKHNVDGIHELNSWIKYPELMRIAIKLSKDKVDLKTLPDRVKEEVAKVDSKMPYKAQFVWEELGKILGFEPA